MSRQPDIQRVYTRPLPGGGVVSIDVEQLRPKRRGGFHGMVVMEGALTADAPERVSPSIIATAHGSTVEAVVQQLFPVAASNYAVASAMLRHPAIPEPRATVSA